ncbi:MAG: hypothetical protein CL878_10000 [Dehalococcoidia bacterium]|nr:hypothetical protein [Dehalococcoidia bacterium]
MNGDSTSPGSGAAAVARPEGAPPSPSSSLPQWRRLLYANGSLGANVGFQALALWLVFFYAPSAEAELPARLPVVTLPWLGTLAPVALAGLILGAGRLVEIFDDPLIGHWSDISRSRWGRRAPFILIGAPVMSIAFVLLWLPPNLEGSFLNAAVLFIVLQLLFFAGTAVAAPYEAWLPELAVSSRDRVSLSAWKSLFGVVGAALALVGSPLLVDLMGFPGMALVLGAVTVLSYYLAVFGAAGRRPRDDSSNLQIGVALRATFTNRPFLVFATSLVLFNFGLSMLTQLLPFFVVAVMGQGEEAVSLYTGVFLLVMLASLPGTVALARRWTKRRTFLVGMGLLALYFPLAFFAGFVPGVPRAVQGLVFIGLAGVPIAGLFVFPNALLADVIDHDALLTGHRREGMYFGVLATINKLALALSSLVFGVVLGVFGSTAANPLGIRLVGPVAGVAVGLGLLIFARGYSLPDQLAAGSFRITPSQGDAR